MNKKEWIRNLTTSMQYYADFYGVKDPEITNVYKLEIAQYADLIMQTPSSNERLGIMDVFNRAAKSWAMEQDERINRKYVMNNDNLVKSESEKKHLKDMASRVKGFLFSETVDAETMYQYAKGCNIYNAVLTKNARRLQANLIR